MFRVQKCRLIVILRDYFSFFATKHLKFRQWFETCLDFNLRCFACFSMNRIQTDSFHFCPLQSNLGLDCSFDLAFATTAVKKSTLLSSWLQRTFRKDLVRAFASPNLDLLFSPSKVKLAPSKLELLLLTFNLVLNNTIRRLLVVHPHIRPLVTNFRPNHRIHWPWS